jgi:hypothetical protein
MFQKQAYQSSRQKPGTPCNWGRLKLSLKMVTRDSILPFSLTAIWCAAWNYRTHEPWNCNIMPSKLSFFTFPYRTVLNLWHWKTNSVDTQCDAEKTERHVQLSVKDLRNNGWPLKSPDFCTVHWALHSGAKGLTLWSHANILLSEYIRIRVPSIIIMICIECAVSQTDPTDMSTNYMLVW